MNMIAQEARKKQEIVKQAIKNGKSYTSRKYGVSLSTLKRWCKKYDGTWQSMLEKSHRPHSHPNRHTPKEEKQKKIRLKSFMPVTDGTEYTVICSVKDIHAAFQEWYMQPKD